jgi:cell division control protein 6
METTIDQENAKLSDNIFEKHMGKKSVFLHKDIISPHHIPKNLPFRENQIDTITQNIGAVVNNSKPNNFFIFGKTGTGKTSTVRHVIDQLREFVKTRELPVYDCYVNCRSHPSKYKVLLKSLKTFYPEKDFLGYSSSFVYEKLLDFARENNAHLILVLDEIDKVKDVDELMYSLSRGNDELDKGSLTVIGISNNLTFKEKLDPRTKSSLCEREMVFEPYNARELYEILKDRSTRAFKEGAVKDEAISLAAALAAQESGDARTAVMLLQRAGEIADEKELDFINDSIVESAKISVEEEIIISMISTLPYQQQLVLYAISQLSLQNPTFTKVSGEVEKGVLFSGEIFDAYLKLAEKFEQRTITSRWFRQYINELEMYGLILVTNSGKGIKGQTRLIKLGFDANKIKAALEKQLFKSF